MKVRAKADRRAGADLSEGVSKRALSFSDSATDTVVVSPTDSGAPLVTLPPPRHCQRSGTGISPTNPSSLFPTVQASPTPSTGSLGLPHAKPRGAVHAADVAATVPVDDRLIGGQLAGLAVLAGAVTIAIARLSCGRPSQTRARTPSRRRSNNDQPIGARSLPSAASSGNALAYARRKLAQLTQHEQKDNAGAARYLRSAPQAA